MWPQQNNFMARDLSVQALYISKRAFIVHVKKERKKGFFKIALSTFMICPDSYIKIINRIS